MPTDTHTHIAMYSLHYSCTTISCTYLPTLSEFYCNKMLAADTVLRQMNLKGLLSIVENLL